MNDRKFKIKGSRLGLNLLRRFAEDGQRIFTIEEARALSKEYGLSEDYIPVVLHYLKLDGWVSPLKRGVYALGPALIGGSPLHEFEIAMHLVQPASISHWSAFHHHGLTQQVPQTVYILTSAKSVPRGARKGNLKLYDVLGISFHFAQVKPSRYFGMEQIWIGDAQVNVTNLERTLLDGLMMPKYCGDFSEVIHAFRLSLERLDIERIVDYSLRMGIAVSKRLGWVLSELGVPMEKLQLLKDLKMSGYRKLDAGGLSKGKYDKIWGVQVNFLGGRYL